MNQSTKPIAYVIERRVNPEKGTRFLSFDPNGHTRDYVCRPLVYAEAMPPAIPDEALDELEGWDL